MTIDRIEAQKSISDEASKSKCERLTQTKDKVRRTKDEGRITRGDGQCCDDEKETAESAMRCNQLCTSTGLIQRMLRGVQRHLDEHGQVRVRVQVHSRVAVGEQLNG